MHAERCPVCMGAGTYRTPSSQTACRGCATSGWVIVPDPEDQAKTAASELVLDRLRQATTPSAPAPARAPTGEFDRVRMSPDLVRRFLEDGQLRYRQEESGEIVVTAVAIGNVWLSEKGAVA